MSAIDTIQNILSGQIGDGKRRLKCVVEPDRQDGKDLIMLFYTNDDNPPLAHSQNISKAVYSRQIECAVRHKRKSKSEEICFQAFELLGKDRQQTNVSLFFTETPTFKGIDKTNGGYIYSFQFLTRGIK